MRTRPHPLRAGPLHFCGGPVKRHRWNNLTKLTIVAVVIASVIAAVADVFMVLRS